MSNLVKLHLICLIALVCITLATAQSTTTTPRNSPQLLDARGRYNPYYNDPYYQNRFFRNRDYYNREYYDNLFKKYNPDIAAPQARIIAQNAELQHGGTYTYSYETENGIQAEERGVPVKVGTEEQKEVVEGSYSYVSPDGMRVIVKYTADENGYHPTITYDGLNAERFARLQQPADIVITRQN
ncbi:PREDICTED: cuticle protein [Rhagoletis zephyria]|uniref:cuticle protein n=1 Tax=Rhagoletis zephyria TaxID=28612 RepID=UPI000811913F|nr:PREDICTED: cuticle protein [Rhagoletis zephyria]